MEDKPVEGKDVDFRQENSEILLKKANYWFEIGQYDSSIFAYNLLLDENPMHIGAINGIKMISNEYINRGKLLIEQKNYENALTYFRKADELNANDQNLQKLILFCEEQVEILSSECQSGTNRSSSDESNLEEKTNRISGNDNHKNYPEVSNSLKIDLSEWNFNNLTDSDYSSYEAGFVFSNTNKVEAWWPPAIDREKPLLAVAPGSGSPAKNWPLAHYYEVTRALVWEYGFQVAWLTGPAEEAWQPYLRGLAAAQEHQVLDKEPLKCVAAVLARTALYLGGDSGLTHLAAAAGARRVVALFGPTDPRVWAPLGGQVTVLAAPRQAADVPAATVFTWETLGPEQVLAKISVLLKNR